MLQYYEGILQGLTIAKTVIDSHFEYYDKLVKEMNQQLHDESLNEN